MEINNIIRRKVLIYIFRVFATMLFFISFLALIAVRLSDIGDVVDRNSGWILALFFIALAIFFKALLTPIIPLSSQRRKMTDDELLNEIRKPNLRKLKNRHNKETE